MTAPVVIVDYGLGNLRSVAGAVTRLGFEVMISSAPADLSRASRLILPGVGAFGDGMINLASRGLIAPLRKLVLEEERPILGICLGAELMARDSDEFGHHEGLGWIPASVRRIAPSDPALRVPHVGWNELRQTRTDGLFHDIPQGALFYFVHSYEIRCDDESDVIATADYGAPVTAAFRRGTICGTQFHPEKSQRHGLTLLGNFLRDA
jgi:imidazole glycerol-phosphate synthase subunit HisH